MYAFVIVIHLLACLLLVAIVLIQSGRGGGLTENFSSMESLFGTKTNSFLTRATAVLATLFIITCLSLTLLSAKRSRSLIEQLPPKATKTESIPLGTAKEAQPPKENTATAQDAKEAAADSKSKTAEIPAAQ